MEKAKQVLLNNFFQSFWFGNALIILGVSLLIILVVLFVVHFAETTRDKRILSIASMIVLTSFLVSFIVFFHNEYKDYRYLKEGNPLVCIEGEIMGYEHTSVDDGYAHHSHPIIHVSKTQKTIVLNVVNAQERLEYGKTYTFIYLPNTRRAEIVEWE